MTNRRRQIDATIGRLERLGAGKLDDAINALLDRRNKIDGCSTGNAGGVRGIRAVTVDEPCTGSRLCTNPRCDSKDERHEHQCPIPQPHDHPASVPVTAVEAAVAAREHIDDLIRNFDDELKAMELIGRNLEKECDKYIKAGMPDLELPKPRCDGGVGYEGYLIARSDGGWSNPGCHEIPDVGRKTCNRCRGAASSWKRARVANGG